MTLASSAAHRRAAARAPGAAPAPMQVGGILRAEQDRFWVDPGPGAEAVPLLRAASCLLVPRPGDTVGWIAAPADRPAGAAAGWIVFVLAHAPAAAPVPAVLRFEGDMRLEVAGRWRAETAALQVQAAEAALQLGEVRVGFRTLRAVGQLLQSTVNSTRWVGEEFCAVVQRWFQQGQSHHRHTEGLDQVQAGTLQLQAETLARIEAPTVLTDGAGLVKTRGAQIHFG
ncbi:DUF3540 domain-containing protein [Pseudacidovorax intermedius]|uniref:DUF3540 domain-containing protein n=1 Tax=Pseudacidovorax intermedius TaxID=433924 RepID=A0A147H565_9BURK|nr:DUF3540 domain-containing protein [Pseudacidovorax intermedius]KTT24995.1 hypothetical protein NS331_05555 [Pseudacidovorax intermedius]